MTNKKKMNRLEDLKVNVRIKIASLWIVIMILYVYNDFFSLFTPGALEEIAAGYMGPFLVTQASILQGYILMAIPTVMIFLSLVLNPKVNRTLNIVLSLLYIVVMVASVIGEWSYYYFMGALEIAANIAIIVYAIKWPKVNT